MEAVKQTWKKVAILAIDIINLIPVEQNFICKLSVHHGNQIFTDSNSQKS